MRETWKKITDSVRSSGEDLLQEGEELVQTAAAQLRDDAARLLEKAPRINERLQESSEAVQNAAQQLRDEAARLMEKTTPRKEWSGVSRIRTASAPASLVPGCLVLEGGSFRGVYTSGVLDVLMENGINLQTVIGTSAGALNGYNYVAGEIGRSALINLRYRHDSRYIGYRSAVRDRGVIGFSFLLDEIEKELDFDRERFENPERRFLATATNIDTGEVAYLEKGICTDMQKAVQASASMPLVSEPVTLEGVSYLDGGCVKKIPYEWALEQHYEKILVVRTRPAYFRREPDSAAFRELAERVYASRPQLAQRLLNQVDEYNRECEELDALDRSGRVLMLAPSGSIETSMLEGDVEKLGGLYLLGRADTLCRLQEIRDYLGI